MSDATLKQLHKSNEQLRLETAELRRQLDGAKCNLAALHQRGEQTALHAARRQHAFLSKLAHDLRNPLAPMHNALEILKLVDQGHEDARRAVEMIDGQVRQLRRLLTDVLDFSRIVCEKITLKKQPVALAAIVAGAVASNELLLAKRKQRFSMSLPETAVWIMGDGERLTQVLSSLLNNAAKYTADGGSIRLAAHVDENDVVCRLIDNGIGIEAEMLPSIFELFAHAERSLDKASHGLGVSLTVIRKLVALHGGTVQALSEGPGRGSEFVVRLPRLASEENPQPPATIGAANRPPRRILIVSTLQFAEEISMLLSIAGHETRSTQNAPAALEAAKQFRPHLIMIDCELPGFEAYGLGQELRMQPGLEKAFLLAIYGTASDKHRQASAAAPWHSQVTKPVKIRDLLRLIAENDALGDS